MNRNDPLVQKRLETIDRLKAIRREINTLHHEKRQIQKELTAIEEEIRSGRNLERDDLIAATENAIESKGYADVGVKGSFVKHRVSSVGYEVFEATCGPIAYKELTSPHDSHIPCQTCYSW